MLVLLTRFHSNIGVQIIVVFNFGTSTLGVATSESAEILCKVYFMLLLGRNESMALMYECVLDFRPCLLPAFSWGVIGIATF